MIYLEILILFVAFVNVNAIPSGRKDDIDKSNIQQCVKCNSEVDLNCVSLAIEVIADQCQSDNDSCFTHINNGIVTRGCLKEVPSMEEDCKNKDLCEICEVTNCNSKSIGKETCYDCDSENNQNCTELLDVSMSKTCPLTLNEMGCYRFDDGGDIIKRGCLSDLISEEVEMCHREGQFCKTCLGNDCNSKVGFQRCRACSSNDTVNCIRSPGSVRTELCPKYLDECFVHVANDVITRGCLSKNQEFEADCKDNDICERCSNQSNCNNKIVDGEFCLTCDSEKDPNCRSNLTIAMRTQCSLAVRKMGCYLFDDGSEIVKRGCLSDLIPQEVEMCREEKEFCKTCLGNDCNSKVGFQRCRACSSNDTVNCIRSPGSVRTELCPKYLDECFVHVANDVITRGCLSKNQDFEADCRDNDICERCSNQSNCNNKIVDGEFCLTCDSEKDPNCRSNLTIAMRTQCSLAVRKMGCYLFDDGGEIVKRGCLSDLIPQEVEMCREEKEFCKTCLGNDCNSKVGFQRCRACSSNDTVNCIRSPGSVRTELCPKYLDECFVHVANDVITRGCLSKNQDFEADCKDNDICERCSNQSNCNNKIVDGEFCLTCDSEKDPNCRSNLTIAMRTQCSLAVRKMGCYLFDDGGEIVKRGCLSDLIPQEVEMCREEKEFCKTCSENDCNSKVGFQRCRACSSNDTVNCIRSPGSVRTELCPKYLDECFVHVANDVITRGCLSKNQDFEADCKDNDICERCSNQSNCNNKIVDGEFCLTCDSEKDPNCRSNLTIAMRTQCSLAVRKMGCYLFDDGGEIVKRGCLSDLIPQEVEMCREEKEFCKTCLGNDCNSKVGFQRCRACSSNDTVNCIRSPGSVRTELCPKYLDECFVHVANDVITRGCLSKNQDFEADCKDNDICERCSNQSNCNNKIVDGEFCLTCDSEKDANCRSNLTIAMRTQCSLAVRKMGCYLFDDGGEIVKRGCLSDLIPQEVEMCREEKEFCKTCLGNDCNSKVGFQRCRACSSNDTVNCIRSPGSVRTELCPKYLDECFVHVANDVITRGCLSKNQDFEADCKDNDICERCSNQSNCNNKIVDGEFCLTCDSEKDPNCRSNLTIAMRTQCSLAVRKMGCYLFDDSGEIVKRGCLSDLIPQEVEMCREEKEFCKTCLGNDCNSKVGFQRCRACSSNDTVNCIRSPGSVRTELCPKYLDECFVHVANDVITRGCLSKNQDFEADCKDNDICERCSNQSNCNNKIVDGEFCLTCDSEKDANCRSNLTIAMRTQCSLAVRKMGCYLFDDGGEIVKRGCLSDLIPQEVEMCREEKEFCKTCLGNDCNSKVGFQRCRACSSNDTVNCIRSPGSVRTELCPKYLDECFVHVDNDVITRGCLSKNQDFEADCKDNDICERCSNQSNCNNKIVDGEFCLTCDSEKDANCRSNLTIAMRTQCSLAVRKMGCYLFDDGAEIVKRGCLSDLIPQEVEMCREEKEFCKTCLGNDCNSKVGFQRCRACSSNDTVNCIRSPGSVRTELCPKYLDECFVHVANDVITRGCLSKNQDFEADCKDNDICERCSNQSNCNNKIVDGEFCLTCDSEKDPNCRSNLTIAMRTQCSLAVRKMGCYLFDDSGEIVKRGCLSDLIPQEVEMCREEKEFCKTCLGNDCNSKVGFQRCRACSSNDTVNCIRSPGSVRTELCPKYLDECFVHVANDIITRGCLGRNETLIEDCRNEDICERCQAAENCNNKIVDGEFCITCDSENDSDCRENPNIAMRTQCSLAVRRMGCYIFDDGGDILKRGCLSDISSFEVEMCRSSNKECWSCLGNDCNNIDSPLIA